MRTNRPYVQIDPDVLERVRQIDLLSYLREFEPSNLVRNRDFAYTLPTLNTSFCLAAYIGRTYLPK